MTINNAPLNSSPALKPRSVAKKDNKKRLTKADIGVPKDFKHISHVGFDPHKGYELEVAGEVDDPQLKKFFDQVSCRIRSIVMNYTVCVASCYYL